MRLVCWELAKLRGSLALLFALVTPGLTALLVLLALIAHRASPSWASVIGQFIMPLWAKFLLPMAVATFCTLVAQVEHRAKSWDHVLTQPFARWRIFLAKLVVVAATVAGMTVLVFVYAYGVAWAGGTILGIAPRGDPQFADVARTAMRLLASASAIVAIQFWVAMRFANFVVPLAVGIAGTLVGLAVLMTGTDKAAWVPWVITLRSVGAQGDPQDA
ncbi:ABC transporter permease [Aurantiacibacter gangjinensis]|nr:ABC transporter permease [Aurantiacibacter gangjinensis]APE27082.1 ABC transporter protein, putative [Aurantiacibacter gangjinensis]